MALLVPKGAWVSVISQVVLIRGSRTAPTVEGVRLRLLQRIAEPPPTLGSGRSSKRTGLTSAHLARISQPQRE